MKPAARRRARECAVQALYSWQLSQNDIADVEYQFLSEQDVKDVDVLYFRELLSGVATNSAYLDGLMKPYLSRLLEELGQVEKAVLRIALFELSKRDDVPYKVAINEAIELAKTGKYDAVIALGTVIRGGTAHFEYVAGGASTGLAHVAQDAEIPVAFGVLTTESIEQAIERAGTKAGNKGAEAALTALEMINVLKAIKA